MRTLIIFSGIMGVLFLASCTHKKMKPSEENQYSKDKASVRNMEIRYPENFLSVDWHLRKNILGQLVLEGRVRNKAAAVTYKNIEMKVSFYGGTRSLLKEETEIVYDSISPGSSQSFRRKYFNSRMSDSIVVQVIKADHTGL